MTEETKTKIISAWKRYVNDHQKRYKKNEGSSVQFEDSCKHFKDGIKNHSTLSKKEKEDLLLQLGFAVSASLAQ